MRCVYRVCIRHRRRSASDFGPVRCDRSLLQARPPRLKAATTLPFGDVIVESAVVSTKRGAVLGTHAGTAAGIAMASAELRKALADALARARNLEGSLQERLASYSGAIRELHPAYANAVDELIARLDIGKAGAAAPAPGEPMPPFLLPDDAGHLVSLEELVESGPAAVMFHRGHWCPWCRISFSALAQVQEDVASSQSRVVAIVPERQEFAAAFKADARSLFPVLSDVDNGYALVLNLAIWVGSELEHLLTGLGRVLPRYQGNDAWMLPIPAAFVVDRDGFVRYRFLDPDFRRRVGISQLVEALRAAR
jgi:peroxiredoxin